MKETVWAPDLTTSECHSAFWHVFTEAADIDRKKGEKNTIETKHDEDYLILIQLRLCSYSVLDRPSPRVGSALRSLGTKHVGLVIISCSDYANLFIASNRNIFESIAT